MAAELADSYLIVKHGLYYRPKGHGYTGIKDEAGRFTLSQVADELCVVEGVSFFHEDEAPEFSVSCCDWLKVDHLRKKRDEALAEVDRLRGFIKDFAEAKFEEVRRMWPSRSPEDEQDPVTDYWAVLGWQNDARELLKGAAA